MDEKRGETAQSTQGSWDVHSDGVEVLTRAKTGVLCR